MFRSTSVPSAPCFLSCMPRRTATLADHWHASNFVVEPRPLCFSWLILYSRAPNASISRSSSVIFCSRDLRRSRRPDDKHFEALGARHRPLHQTTRAGRKSTPFDPVRGTRSLETASSASPFFAPNQELTVWTGHHEDDFCFGSARSAGASLPMFSDTTGGTSSTTVMYRRAGRSSFCQAVEDVSYSATG